MKKIQDPEENTRPGATPLDSTNWVKFVLVTVL